MKKLFTLFVFALLLFSFASFGFVNAQENDTDNSGSSSDSETDSSGSSDSEDEEDNSGSSNDETEIESDNRERDITRERIRERDGEVEREFERRIITEDGEEIKIERKIIIKDGETEIKTRLKIEGAGANLSIVDSQGERHRVRVTPERLRTLMTERLQADNITEFSFEEVTDRNVPRVVFKVNSEHPGRFLGVLKLSMKAETQVDPETGEIIDVNVPWWAFLVTGEEISDELVGNETVGNDLIANDEELEEEFEDIEIDEELEIKAETSNGISEVKIELEFETETVNTNSVISEVLSKLALSSEEIDSFLEMETSDEPIEEKDELEFETDSDEEDLTEVEFEWKFIVANDNRETIVSEIAERLSSLTEEDILSALEAEEDLEDEDVEEEINEIIIELEENSDSGETGTATLVEENGQVIVTIETTGFVEDVSQPAHIHVGSCPDVGTIEYPLENLVNGESTTTIDTTFTDLEAQLPLGLNIHKSVEEASTYTACGDLKF